MRGPVRCHKSKSQSHKTLTEVKKKTPQTQTTDRRPPKKRATDTASLPKQSGTTNGPSDSPDNSLSPREHEFSSTSWRLIDIDSDSNDVITQGQGATPSVKRCVRVYSFFKIKATNPTHQCPHASICFRKELACHMSYTSSHKRPWCWLGIWLLDIWRVWP